MCAEGAEDDAAAGSNGEQSSCFFSHVKMLDCIAGRTAGRLRRRWHCRLVGARAAKPDTRPTSDRFHAVSCTGTARQSHGRGKLEACRSGDAARLLSVRALIHVLMVLRTTSKLTASATPRSGSPTKWWTRFNPAHRYGARRAWNLRWYTERANQRTRLQTDSTRAKNRELAYQTRLAGEMEKLRDMEAGKVDKALKAQSDEAIQPPSFAEKVGEALTPERQRQREMSRETVAKEISTLKKTMDTRKKLAEVDPALQNARDEVVGCLRTNDRRPLDCWQQVDNFKKEVSRLERKFVEKTLR